MSASMLEQIRYVYIPLVFILVIIWATIWSIRQQKKNSRSPEEMHIYLPQRNKFYLVTARISGVCYIVHPDTGIYVPIATLAEKEVLERWLEHPPKGLDEEWEVKDLNIVRRYLAQINHVAS